MTESPNMVHARNARHTALFCLAAAVTVAAAIDPAMEWLSNRGLFGPGQLTDRSNLDVIPALLAGFVFSLLVVAGLVRRAIGGRAYAPDWLRRCAVAGDERAVVTLLPAIFALQLFVLWAMETLEQFVVAGHPLGGTIWLGGPIAVSLAFHAAGCLTFTGILSLTLRWSAQTIVQVVTLIRRLCSRLAPLRTARPVRALEIPASRFLAPIIARLNGRAPPFLTA
jgi:hypothetical protein